MLAYLGLFVSALLSATVVPGSSELVIVALLAGGHDALALVGVATAGNVAGSVLNWWLGRVAVRYQDRRWFPVGRDTLARVAAWYARWGLPCLLLAWVPVVGDAFTVLAGATRVPLPTFVALVGLAKAGRYAAQVGAAQVGGISGWLGPP